METPRDPDRGPRCVGGGGVTLFMDDGQVALHHGHALDVLRELPSESVQCCVTSPPYWALRSYGTEAQVWGGDAEVKRHDWDCKSVQRVGSTPAGVCNCSYHEHVWDIRNEHHNRGDSTAGAKQRSNVGAVTDRGVVSDATCPCGAWRGELGHEPRPQMFVAHLVEVFREVQRVLKSDGVCFVNLGDSYSGSGKGPSNSLQRPASSLNNGQLAAGAAPTEWIPVPPGTKPKDLVLIPERFALAAQDDGWYVRSRIAWCKRAPMPESVRDRPTNAWEHIWMLTKSARYYWDADAVREDYARLWDASAPNGKTLGPGSDYTVQQGQPTGHVRQAKPIEPKNGRNIWSYWLLSPDPEPLAHFATFPREIPRRCIAAATREGDTVLDPFVGSGTTTQVARSMLRRSIGIDLNETYLRDIALRKNAQMALMAEPA